MYHCTNYKVYIVAGKSIRIYELFCEPAVPWDGVTAAYDPRRSCRLDKDLEFNNGVEYVMLIIAAVLYLEPN